MTHLKDLERCGIATSNTLNEVLTTSADPVDALRRFQEQNAIQLPSLKPAMMLLDLHGVRQAEYHEAVNVELVERILAKIRTLGETKPLTEDGIRKLEQQLERSFRLYRLPRLRPIVLETLRQLPCVADRYLKLIVCDKDLYDACAVEVKQQIWLRNNKMFREAMEPIVDSYLQEKELLLLEAGDGGQPNPVATNFFTADTTRSRRQWRQVQELLNAVGERETLYTQLVELIRERYLASTNPHLCSLRLELLMAAHDANVETLLGVDPCHEFVWCLDACLRDRHLDAQQTSKLRALLEPAAEKGSSTTGIPKRVATSRKREIAFGDIAMIAADPHVTHFLASMAVKVLRDNASSGQCLPRDHTALHLVIKLMEMGTHSRELLQEDEEGEISDEDSGQQLLNPEMVTCFLPALATMFTQDMLRLELLKVVPKALDAGALSSNLGGELQELINDEAALTEVPEVVDEWLRQSEVAALLWIHYIVDNLLLAKKRQQGRRDLILRYLQLLPKLAGNMAAKPLWFHLIVSRLIQSNQYDTLLADENLAELVLQALFLNSTTTTTEEEAKGNLGDATMHANFQLLRLALALGEMIPTQLQSCIVEHLLRTRERLSQEDDNAGDKEVCLASKRFTEEFDANVDLLLPPDPETELGSHDESAPAVEMDEGGKDRFA